MGRYVADQVTKLMTKKRIHVVDANILIMGLTFKENCPDLRNTQYRRSDSCIKQLQLSCGCLRPLGRQERGGRRVRYFTH